MRRTAPSAASSSAASALARSAAAEPPEAALTSFTELTICRAACPAKIPLRSAGLLERAITIELGANPFGVGMLNLLEDTQCLGPCPAGGGGVSRARVRVAE